MADAKDSKAPPKVVIYTRALCGYCMAARKLLKQKGVAYEEIDTTLNAKKKREMIERSGRHTVPQIFIDGQHIGGYDDMDDLDAAGRLDAMLGLDP
ncbi:MAG: glutaredoxin 3 [Gammaproteobacteria bacterium]|nr:glutaredoxin 3 [Gammaproteobacteria bacterium]MBT8444273.1 glutaredoxin 3 [Gammaproteobacteria bacterium]NND37828.1 glutaredoxin 3 [Gammaproteobacteria bacterium]